MLYYIQHQVLTVNSFVVSVEAAISTTKQHKYIFVSWSLILKATNVFVYKN